MEHAIKKLARPHVIVLGNEKGGTGKSTLAMHVITSLLHQGFLVGSLDIDARQGTLSRYIENRHNYIQKMEQPLPLPTHHRLMRSTLLDIGKADEEDVQHLSEIFEQCAGQDFIVIDTPGSDNFLSRKAHSYADTLITPLNDSFIDLDLLVRLDISPENILHPSLYSEMVWEQRKQRAMRDNGTIEWIVLRNRMGSLRTRNRDQMDHVLTLLAKRIGFKMCAGFGERVIFKELFLSGLTLLDVEKTGIPLTISHVTARQELRTLMGMIPALEKSQKIAAAAAS